MNELNPYQSPAELPVETQVFPASGMGDDHPVPTGALVIVWGLLALIPSVAPAVILGVVLAQVLYWQFYAHEYELPTKVALAVIGISASVMLLIVGTIMHLIDAFGRSPLLIRLPMFGLMGSVTLLGAHLVWDFAR